MINKNVENLKSERIASAMKDAVAKYSRLEQGFDKLDAIVTELKQWGIDLFELEEARVLSVHVSEWNFSPLVEIWASYKARQRDKATFDQILIALTGAFGEAERDAQNSTDIAYKWSNDIRLSMSADLAGCKLVEKEVEVPAQPATTKKVYEIECGGGDS